MSTFPAARGAITAVLLLPLLALTGCMGTTGAPSSGGSASESSAPSSSMPAEEETDPAGEGAEVIAMGLAFVPTDITVAAGTTVRWVNQEAITHTVTSGPWGDVNESTGLRGSQTPDGTYDHTLSPMGEDGDTFEFTFTEPGTYQFFCRPHAGMFGTITVE
ncbi:MAG TPA: plastocyanin/azurin family copper-binding protein [Naasia sp.]|jgi:plastocyanin